MHSRSLKVNIITTLMVLLAVAMIFIYIVMNFIYQNETIHEEINKIESLALVITSFLDQSSANNEITIKGEFTQTLQDYLKQTGNHPVLLAGRSGKSIFEGNMTSQLGSDLLHGVKKCLNQKKMIKEKIGKTWGAFNQWQYLVVSIPIYKNQALVGGMSAAVRYEHVHLKMLDAQSVIFFYIAVNTLLLTLIGFYRINNITIKPIRKLVNQAETYKDDNESFGFIFNKEKNEFGRLSKALNRMLNRITEDKAALKTSVKSLEKLNIELKKAQNKIIRAEKLASVGRLSAGIAHEIGNPISIVLGYLELLKSSSLTDPERSEYISRANKEINRIDGIIKQLLDFARPAKEINTAIAVHELIEETTTIFKDQPVMSQNELILQFTANLQWVEADANRLRQVFLNLMINAADAIAASDNAEKGRIVIRTENFASNKTTESRPMLKIQFSDNGIGIPPDCIDNIFDPFFTTKAPGKGTGLGLSVSYMIVEQMEGTIVGECNDKQGTQISILLPTCNL